MARKLPWQTGSQAGGSGHVAKKRKVQEEEVDDDDKTPSPARTPQRRAARDSKYRLLLLCPENTDHIS